MTRTSPLRDFQHGITSALRSLTLSGFGLIAAVAGLALVTFTVAVWVPFAVALCLAVAVAAVPIVGAVTLWKRLFSGDRISTQNPVLIEARHRGDYADFAAQLRREAKPERWKSRDVQRALPTIDQWARESGQA